MDLSSPGATETGQGMGGRAYISTYIYASVQGACNGSGVSRDITVQPEAVLCVGPVRTGRAWLLARTTDPGLLGRFGPVRHLRGFLCLASLREVKQRCQKSNESWSLNSIMLSEYPSGATQRRAERGGET